VEGLFSLPDLILCLFCLCGDSSSVTASALWTLRIVSSISPMKEPSGMRALLSVVLVSNERSETLENVRA